MRKITTSPRCERAPGLPRCFSNRRALIGLGFYAAGVILALLCVGFYPGGTALAAERNKGSQIRQLSLADRVTYQQAIEEVYWRHRIWPKENPDPKHSLGQMMSSAELEQKVLDYLRNSQALADYWQRPITAEQLQAEIERMVQHTGQPGLLRELFAALGNDPFIIAECLARPVLSERLARNLYAYDQRFHGELRMRAEAELRAHPSAEEAKQTSGTIHEVIWIKGDHDGGNDRDPENAVRIDSRKWAKKVKVLEETAGNNIGGLGPLQDDEWRYSSTAITAKTEDRIRQVTIEWRKEPFETWRARAESQMPTVMAVPVTRYVLPTLSDAEEGCAEDSWTATTTSGAPEGRALHTAVWTGSEMIVWGGGYENTGGRYNPSTDSWMATSTTNAPTSRSAHTAVWTGSEMIVWGGGYQNTGGRYNPSTDSWIATTTSGAPVGRQLHKAVWTGSEMIVWGGRKDSPGGAVSVNTGGRYNPNTDSWVETSSNGAPPRRYGHPAVWTGSEMIVWGGTGGFGFDLADGGRYNPNTDSWVETSFGPPGAFDHTAVWAGSEMIVWGGLWFAGTRDTGGRYNPITDSWLATSTSGAPTPRFDHTAVWTGSEMIVWGGEGAPDNQNTGGRYNPSTDSWMATTTSGAPEGRELHTAVWTGSEMIVWGGVDGNFVILNTGGRYIPTVPGGCVLGHRYWMNHPESWCIETIQIGCMTFTQAQAIAIMRHNASHDKTYSLAQQLIAVKLNILCRCSDPTCVSGAIAAANSWLCDHPVGSGVTANSSAWQQIKAVHNALAAYNGGQLCAPSCDAH